MLRKNGSKSMIMKVCRQIVAEEGIAGLNMRKVAKRTNLAIGSIYYYFPSKDELLIASIESVWDDIFSLDQVDLGKIKLSEYISLTYTNIKKGMEAACASISFDFLSYYDLFDTTIAHADDVDTFLFVL